MVEARLEFQAAAGLAGVLAAVGLALADFLVPELVVVLLVILIFNLLGTHMSFRAFCPVLDHFAAPLRKVLELGLRESRKVPAMNCYATCLSLESGRVSRRRFH